MRAYRIEFRGKVRFAATQSLAQAAKVSALEGAGLSKRSGEATVKEEEIPYGKAELIDWVNELIKSMEVTEDATKAGEAEPDI